MQVVALFLDAHLGPGAEVPEETPAAGALLDQAVTTAAWVAPFSVALGASHAATRSQCTCKHANYVPTKCEATGASECDKSTRTLLEMPALAETCCICCGGSQAQPRSWANFKKYMRAGRGDLAQLWDAARASGEEGSGTAVYQPGAGAALPGGVLAHAYGGELMDEGMPSR